MRTYTAQVGAVHIAATNEADLAHAVAEVEAGKPALAQHVRLKGKTKPLGIIDTIDTGRTRTRVRVNGQWHDWRKLEYA